MHDRGRLIIANEEIPGQSYVISKSKGGILINYDYYAIALAMTQLIDDLKKRSERGENGRK